jgi:hypothetical protein
VDECCVGSDGFAGIFFDRRNSFDSYEWHRWSYIDDGWNCDVCVRVLSDNLFSRLLLILGHRISQSWHYMSILTEHLPAAVLILTNGRGVDFTTAVYRQFTSETARPWFKAMPTEAQGFVLLDYLPNWLSEPMTLDAQQLATVARPAARPTSTTWPTSTSNPMPLATSQGPGKTSGKNGPLVAVILIPLMLLALALGFSIYYIRHRKRRRARSLANNLPHKATDLECVETQSDRTELEGQTAPLVRC